MAITGEMLDSYFGQRPHYFTDGKHFYANPSYRKARGLHYIGRFLNAKEARMFYELWRDITHTEEARR